MCFICFRSISCYNDKVVNSNIFAKYKTPLFIAMLYYSKLSFSEVENMFYAHQGLYMFESKSAFKLRTFPCKIFRTETTPSNYEEKFNPTFRGFILGVIFERINLCNSQSNKKMKLCLTERDHHIMRFVTNCAPCDINYDGIIKVESECRLLLRGKNLLHDYSAHYQVARTL